MVQVRKKNGDIESVQSEKISRAIRQSSSRVKEVDWEDMVRSEKIALIVLDKISSLKKEIVETSEIHLLVLQALFDDGWKEVYDSYSIYRAYRKDLADTYEDTYKEAEGIIYAGDKENANKESALNATKQSLIGESVMRTYMKKYELKPEWVEAHEKGFIHIHDMSSRFIRSVNCCLFDIESVLKGGFEINGGFTNEPKRFDSAINVIGDVILTASANQYGGFSIGRPLDTVLAPYAEKSYQKHLEDLKSYFSDVFDGNFLYMADDLEERLKKSAEKMTIEEIEQGIQGFEVKLNTINSALAQIPFTTIAIGIDQTKWGREIAKAILKIRKNGMANNVSAVFPKIIMLCKDEINLNEDSPNYDIFNLAINCSSTRLYPDYLSLNSGGFIGDTFDRSGTPIVPMGCRSYLNRWYHPETGEETYVGRGNIGVVSLGITKFALESKGNLDEFFSLIEKYAKMAFEIHEDYKAKLRKVKGSSNPLAYTQGGFWKKVDYDEEIGDMVDAFTASLGFVGIEEALNALNIEDKNKQEVSMKICQFMKDLCDEAKEETGTLFSLYSSPAESLIYRFMKLNQKEYGIITGVTDREYLTNSWHYPVYKDISVVDKIEFETPFHEIATGGHISVAEFVHGVDHSVLRQAVKFAMSKPSMYFGVNVVSTTCNDCGELGDFRDKCPNCNSQNLTEVNRTCGYLSFSQLKGDTRYNPGKQAEILERVKHQ